MEFLRPATWAEALAAKAANPEALPITGGTDVMVELNFGRRRPAVLLDLTRVSELGGWSEVAGRLRVGGAVTYAELTGERGGGDRGGGGLGRRLPGLALAARTVGSPQIRNRGTIGGNLGSASPAGARPNADCRAVRCRSGRSAARGRTGWSRRCRPAKPIADSARTPATAATRIWRWPARCAAAASSRDFPDPAGPVTTSVPPRPAHAERIRSSTTACSRSRPYRRINTTLRPGRPPGLGRGWSSAWSADRCGSGHRCVTSRSSCL